MAAVAGAAAAVAVRADIRIARSDSRPGARVRVRVRVHACAHLAAHAVWWASLSESDASRTPVGESREQEDTQSSAPLREECRHSAVSCHERHRCATTNDDDDNDDRTPNRDDDIVARHLSPDLVRVLRLR